MTDARNPATKDGLSTPLIVTVAPNGARRGKSEHPGLPIRPDEIADSTVLCREAGAAMLHLHVRDADGNHSLDPDAYRAAITAVRARVGEDMVIQITTEAAGRFDRHQQMATVRAVEPEAVSLGLRELIPREEVIPEASRFLAWAHSLGMFLQYILYSAEDVATFVRLHRDGVIPGTRPSVLFVLGRYATNQVSEPKDLVPFLRALDTADHGGGPGPVWTVCAFGQYENACALAAAALGGHVRVGFENNLWRPDGSVAEDNAELVGRACDSARLLNRPLATAAEARAMMRGWL